MDYGLRAEQVGGHGPKSDGLLDRFPELNRDLDVADAASLTLAKWDRLPEVERQLRRERFDRDRSIHQGCGYAHEVCSDAEKSWFPQLSVCYATMEERAAQDRFERLHKDRPWHDGTFPEDRGAWVAERDAEHPYHVSWGTRVFVAETDLELGGDFLLQGGGANGLAAAGDGVEAAEE